MLTLAIDLGSTNIKAAVIDPTSQAILAQKRLPTQYLPSRGPFFCEVDPYRLFTQVETLLANFLSQFPEVGSLRLSTQMHGFLFATPEGRPLTPYISWRDNRCLRVCHGISDLDLLRQRLTPKHLKPTGVPLKAGLAMCNAFSLLRQADDPIPSGSLFCTLGSYVLLRLGGRNITHITNAAATGFVNLLEQNWSSALLSEAGFQNFSFPKIEIEVRPCGMLSFQGRPIILYPDIGDQQAAVLGSLSLPSEEVNVNLATAGQLACVYERFLPGPYEIRPYFGGRYLNTVTRIPAGRNLDLLLQFIQQLGRTVFHQEKSIPEICQQLSAGIPNCHETPLDLDLNFFPDMLEGQSGSIRQITANNFTPENLLLCAYQSIARTYQRHLQAFSSFITPKQLVFSGGVARNHPFLLREIIQATHLPGHLSPFQDEVLMGHCKLAMKAAGLLPSVEATNSNL